MNVVVNQNFAGFKRDEYDVFVDDSLIGDVYFDQAADVWMYKLNGGREETSAQTKDQAVMDLVVDWTNSQTQVRG